MSWALHHWLRVWEPGRQTGQRRRGRLGQRCGGISGPHFTHSQPDDRQIRVGSPCNLYRDYIIMMSL